MSLMRHPQDVSALAPLSKSLCFAWYVLGLLSKPQCITWSALGPLSNHYVLRCLHRVRYFNSYILRVARVASWPAQKQHQL